MIIAITGASGLVGKPLVASLEAEGHLVRQLVRREVQDADREVFWDPVAGHLDPEELNGVDAVVHLAGENVAGGRWSARRKKAILDSRVQGTRLLCETLAKLDHKPSMLCSASAIGFYGDRGDALLEETAPAGEGFLADLCQQWEQETGPASDAGIRVVNLRIGVVMSPQGGALSKMLLPFKLGLGGVIGSGQQFVSWIELGDLISAIRFVIENDSLHGPVNATAPEPVTNHELTKTLGQVLHRPTIFPMPGFAARLAFGEMADEMLLCSSHVLPRSLTEAGFSFDHPNLESALRHLLNK